MPLEIIEPAQTSGARGREFESRRSDHLQINSLDRSQPLRFDSLAAASFRLVRLAFRGDSLARMTLRAAITAAASQAVTICNGFVPPLARRFGQVAGLVVAAGLIASAPYAITVVDGDTVDRIWRHRLAGYDAPEIRRPRCAAEREAGLKAKARLEELIAGGRDVRLARAQWRLDKYGRVLGRLTIDGRDVAEIAIAEGWGRPYDGRSKPEGWCP